MSRTRKIYANHLEIGDVIPHDHRARRFVEWTVTSVLRTNERTTYTVHNAGNGITVTCKALAYDTVYVIAD